MRDDRYKWLLLVFLIGTFVLEQAARQVYGATLPQIKLDFAGLGIDDSRLGLVSSVFTLVFGFALVGSGLAADFFGRKLVLVLGTTLFSAGVLLGGFAQSIGSLVVFFGVVNALGQCCIAPPAYSLISQHHDERTRSTAMGIFQGADYLGIILASSAAGWIAGLGGGMWRIAFMLVGGLGIAWAVALGFLMRNTPQPSADRPTVRDAFGALVRKPTAVLIAVAFGMFMYTNCALRLWTVAFIQRSFEGVSLASAAFHAVFWFYVGALIGISLTARALDFVGGKRPSVRLETSFVGFLLCIAPMIAVAYSSTLVGCCASLAALGVTVGVYEAAHYPAMFDCIEPRYRSVATGLTGCLAFLIASFAPMTVGWMSDHLSMRLAMASMAVFFLMGALVLLPAIFVFFKKDYVGR